MARMSHAAWGPSMPKVVPKEPRSASELGAEKAKQAEAAPAITDADIDRVMKVAFAMVAADEARDQGHIH